MTAFPRDIFENQPIIIDNQQNYYRTLRKILCSLKIWNSFLKSSFLFKEMFITKKTLVTKS